jgi:hypothetical protein
LKSACALDVVHSGPWPCWDWKRGREGISK